MKQSATISLTWPQILAIEPRLGRLAAEARRLDPDDWRGYERLKAQLDLLAGWKSPHPDLAGSFDRIHRMIFDGPPAEGSA
jgi:hypothetical protein